MLRRSDEGVAHDLVGRLYDAALDRERWPLFLDGLAGAIDAHAFGLSFIAFDFWQGRPPLSLGIDSAFLPSYPRYHEGDKAWSHALRAQPVAEVRDVLPWRTLARTPMYEEWLRPQRLRHVVHVLLWRDMPMRAGLLSGRRDDARPFGRRERALLQLLVPHLRRAIDIQRRFGAAESTAAATLDVLDALTIGVLLVDAHARIAFANRAAEELLRSCPEIAPRRGVLTARDPRVARALARLVAGAAFTTATRGLGTGGALAVPRRNGAPLQMLITPLGRNVRAAWSIDGMAAILLTDPDRAPVVSREILPRLYGLTAAQSELAALLAEGRSLSEIADALAFTINTVRDRTKQVFARTGVRRQSELVALLLRGPATVRRER
jgi:DNA-binding CsgD family transcriptional regulator